MSYEASEPQLTISFRRSRQSFPVFDIVSFAIVYILKCRLFRAYVWSLRNDPPLRGLKGEQDLLSFQLF